jgi:hypothetical protein
LFGACTTHLGSMYALTSSNISCSFDGVTYDLNLRCVCIENRVSFCQRLFLPTEPRRGSGTRRSRGRGCCLPRLAFRGRGGAQSSGIVAGMEGTPPTPPRPIAILTRAASRSRAEFAAVSLSSTTRVSRTARSQAASCAAASDADRTSSTSTAATAPPTMSEGRRAPPLSASASTLLTQVPLGRQPRPPRAYYGRPKLPRHGSPSPLPASSGEECRPGAPRPQDPSAPELGYREGVWCPDRPHH